MRFFVAAFDAFVAISFRFSGLIRVFLALFPSSQAASSIGKVAPRLAGLASRRKVVPTDRETTSAAEISETPTWVRVERAAGAS